VTLGHEFREERSHFSQRDAEIDVRVVECARRHAGIRRISRVLHDGHPAAPLDGDQVSRAVVEHARQDAADDTGTVRDGGRAKERVNGRPLAVFARSFGDTYVALLDQDVMIRRRNIDTPWLIAVTILGQLRPKGLVAVQTAQQGLSGILKRQVLDNENGGGKVRGQSADESIERFQSSRRRTDHDDVSSVDRPDVASFLARNLHGRGRRNR